MKPPSPPAAPALHRSGAAEPPQPTPYVPPEQDLAEFTLRAALPGILLGILFGAANAYLGLRAGLTVSTSIPIAVMTVSAFALLRRLGARPTILEANLSQTVGSASSSIASGAIFTLPALFMWGMPPSLLQITLLACCGGLLGTLFMIPLRPLLIAREHGRLPYPEGTACAQVLIASEVGGSRARNVFLGLGAGAAFKFVFGWLKLFPDELALRLPLIPRAGVALSLSSALFGVGYILGPRIGSIMVAGGMLSAVVIIPLIAWIGRNWTEPYFPETQLTIAQMSAGQIWNRYVRYLGAGAVATAGLITLLRSVPMMVSSFSLGAAQLRARLRAGTADAAPRTQRDLPLRTIAAGVLAVVLSLALTPHAFGTIDGLAPRAVAAVSVAVLGFFFVTVAARIVGLVGQTSNPISGMTIASLIGVSLAFLALGWTDRAGMAAALCVGSVVAIAASMAGDLSQDLKTGFLLGATPRRQQIGELLGALTSAVFIGATLLLLNEGYKDPQTGVGFGTKELAAPQATLMKLVIEGVLEQKLPWVLVGIGAGLALLAEAARIPSLPFSVGVYLPVATMVPVFLGGMLRAWIERRGGEEPARAARRENGVLFGSGLVGGEGLMGVLIAGVVFYQSVAAPGGMRPPLPLEIGHEWLSSAAPPAAELGALGMLVLLAIVFIRRCRAAAPGK